MYTVINGISNHSLQLAFDLLSLEARVLLLDERDLGSSDIATNLSDELLSHPFSKKLNADSFQNLFKELYQSGIYRPVNKVRFGKKYLLKNELEGSRMKDLFRVISYSDKLKIEKELPFEGASEKLTKDFQASLDMAREDFEDCDFVVTDPLRVNFHKNYPTVNLDILSEDDNIEFSTSLDTNSQFTNNSITIIGDSIEASQLILSNEDWFLDLDHHMDLVCFGQRPFENIKGTQEFEQIMSFFDRLEEFLNKSFEDYRHYVFERREQKLPVDKKEPKETISFFLGYRALVLDKLYDRDEYYLTLEKPSFNGQPELKTLAAEKIFYLMDSSCHEEVESIKEEGLFFLNHNESVQSESQRVTESMMRYFSRND
jgi:hypothetical protein